MELEDAEEGELESLVCGGHGGWMGWMDDGMDDGMGSMDGWDLFLELGWGGWMGWI